MSSGPGSWTSSAGAGRGISRTVTWIAGWARGYEDLTVISGARDVELGGDVEALQAEVAMT